MPAPKALWGNLPDDNDEKLRLYEQAAKDGSATAQHQMALTHENYGDAELVKTSFWKMKEYYEMAAAQEHPGAMIERVIIDFGNYDADFKNETGQSPELNLGRAYETGKKLIDLNTSYVSNMLENFLPNGICVQDLFNARAQGDEIELTQMIVMLGLMEYFAQKQLAEIQAERGLNNGDPGAPAPSTNT